MSKRVGTGKAIVMYFFFFCFTWEAPFIYIDVWVVVISYNRMNYTLCWLLVATLWRPQHHNNNNNVNEKKRNEYVWLLIAGQTGIDVWLKFYMCRVCSSTLGILTGNKYTILVVCRYFYFKLNAIDFFCLHRMAKKKKKIIISINEIHRFLLIEL